MAESRVRALFALAAIRLALWILPLRWVRAFVERGRVRRRAGAASPDTIARAVAAAGKRVPRGWTCLPQALATQYLLRRHGHVSELRLGVTRTDDGTFAAHAWVTCDGETLVGGDQAGDFEPLEPR